MADLDARSAAGRRPLALRRPLVGAALHLVERLAAVVGLIMVAPLLALIALAIAVSDPGPVLFRQVRVGQYGRRFTIYKFRTMWVGAETQLDDLLAAEGIDEQSPFDKILDDPRVTRVGRFLRRSSLDELPQLWNVVTGTMSLVGPRPQTPAEVASYDDSAWRRLLVRPGITGLWQVSGRNDLSSDRALQLDAEYGQNWSPMLDVRVLGRTAGAVVTQRGAY